MSVERNMEAEPDTPIDPEYYLCESCGDSFAEWTGGLKVKNENEYYCPTCIGKNKHYEFILDCACDDVKAANMVIESLEGC